MHFRFGEGKQAKCGACAIQASYDEGVTDEFVVPTVVAKDGEAVGKIQDKDSVIFFNFRPDRAREMTHVSATTSLLDLIAETQDQT